MRLRGVFANDEGAAGGLDDVTSDDGEVVDLHDAGDLCEEAVDEPDVSAGDASDCGDGLGVGEVGQVQGQAELGPLSGEDEREIGVAEVAVLVAEPNAAPRAGGGGTGS